MFKSIVWATDGSPAADGALAYVKDLARGDDAEITIAHVVERGHSSGAAFLPRRQEELAIVERLEQVEQELTADGFRVSLKVADEAQLRPAHELVEIATAAGADLIVVGTRGLSAAALVLGSTTYRLLHNAPCPVLVIPPSKEERTG